MNWPIGDPKHFNCRNELRPTPLNDPELSKLFIEHGVTALDDVTLDEALSLPCIRCQANEGDYCWPDPGSTVRTIHVERVDWAARFYGEFLPKDQERVEI